MVSLSSKRSAPRMTASWCVGGVEVGPLPQGASPWDPHGARAQGWTRCWSAPAPVALCPRQSARVTSEDGFQKPRC